MIVEQDSASTIFSFIHETYETEILKTISVWGSFTLANWRKRPSAEDSRGRTAEEHFMHQCVSEDTWFKNMLGVDLGRPALPEPEPSIAVFMRHYSTAARQRCAILAEKSDAWWLHETAFFDVPRNRAWIMLRRLTHSAHHRGQLTSMLRSWGLTLFSTYGPTADTGGLAPFGGKTLMPSMVLMRPLPRLKQAKM